MTQATKASIPSTTFSNRMDWNRLNECCPPGQVGVDHGLG
jgi:hypothetical protein